MTFFIQRARYNALLQCVHSSTSRSDARCGEQNGVYWRESAFYMAKRQSRDLIATPYLLFYEVIG